MEVIGIHSGFIGLLNKDVQVFDERSLSGILNLGGTILGTSREKPFRKLLASGDSEKPEIIKKNYEELGLDCLVCIGGNGTQKTANLLSQIGLNVIGVPKTIDNDIWGTDITFGFNTAVNIATESIDRLHSTASSHKRVMVVEVMGHHAGWIALYAGMAGGADVILLPELGYDIDKVNEAILDRARRGKPYSIVVVAEGIETPDKKRPSDYITRAIEAGTGIETRDTVLGYTQRGGNPSPFDRNLATRLGGHATELIANGEFGRMVCMKGDRVESIPLLEVAGKLKLVTPDHDLIVQGKCTREVLEALKKYKKGDMIDFNGFEIKEGETSPPKRYNSGSMILAMENAGQLIEDEELRAQIKGSGIGTSATRAEILKKLNTIKYISTNKKTQVITPTLLGEIIYDVVECSMKQLLNPELTASWEKGLTYVAEGSITSQEYMDKLEGFVGRRTQAVMGLNNQRQLIMMFDESAKNYK